MHTTDGNLTESDLRSKFLQQFKKDVSDGLNSDPKTLPSKYFYDETGDDLFVQIMNMPEYYLTRCEMEIFTEQTEHLINEFDLNTDEPFELIELGAGDGSKTIKLLQRLLERGHNFHYNPVDISANALQGLEDMLAEKLPELKVKKQRGDYFGVLSSFKGDTTKKVVLFLGSNIGNMRDEKASDFIYRLGANLNPGDILLMGVDLIKPTEIVLPAYNDSNGITAKFNLNLLKRINRELGANFDLDNWSHAPTYSEETGIAKSFLRSDVDQEVYVEGIGQDFFFEEGELIHTEISRKYNDEILKDIISDTNFYYKSKIQDSRKFFADYILIRK
ncbi:MAG: L-histidine N(alpha)-methyltransferase [Crocinitomicaceae bacterium]|nr:L-histidine N(alpha)-methyltransferase [Crocinitomicaceae bacterium]